jgi:anti-anti-sigma regulatory factor
MLRILRDDVAAHRVILILQGRIVAEWPEVLERECMEMIQAGLRITLELSGVVFIGRSGVEVLGRLGRAGVVMKGCSPLIADMLEQEGIAAGRNVADMNDRTVPWKRGSGTDA